MATGRHLIPVPRAVSSKTQPDDDSPATSDSARPGSTSSTRNERSPTRRPLETTRGRWQPTRTTAATSAQARVEELRLQLEDAEHCGVGRRPPPAASTRPHWSKPSGPSAPPSGDSSTHNRAANALVRRRRLPGVGVL